MKKFMKIVSSVVIGLSFVGAGSQVVSAATSNAPLAPAEVAPTDPAVKKGQKIFVIVKDTKKQTVAVYDKNANKTKSSVKMGSTFTAKDVKTVNHKKIVKISNDKWLLEKDVTQD